LACDKAEPAADFEALPVLAEDIVLLAAAAARDPVVLPVAIFVPPTNQVGKATICLIKRDGDYGRKASRTANVFLHRRVEFKGIASRGAVECRYVTQRNRRRGRMSRSNAERQAAHRQRQRQRADEQAARILALEWELKVTRGQLAAAEALMDAAAEPEPLPDLPPPRRGGDGAVWASLSRWARCLEQAGDRLTTARGELRHYLDYRARERGGMVPHYAPDYHAYGAALDAALAAVAAAEALLGSRRE
jgi:hypothetical protein